MESIRYPVSERALEKWSQQQLECVAGDDRHYRFRYQGSTCSNGGTAFEAWLCVKLKDDEPGFVVAQAWVEIPERAREAAARMCAAGASSRADAFFERLTDVPEFVGRSIAGILEDGQAVNPAGCFCTPAMERHKWNLAFSTIHYHLMHRAQS